MKLEDLMKYWIDSAEENLKAAQSNFDTGHYDWCLFIGHLALEKILKVHWIKFHDSENHPRIHNLVILAQDSNLSLTDSDNKFLRLVNAFYLENRYPDYRSQFHKLAKKEFTLTHFNHIKEFFQCLKSRLE